MSDRVLKVTSECVSVEMNVGRVVRVAKGNGEGK
jgi:hypothetical protein